MREELAAVLGHRRAAERPGDAIEHRLDGGACSSSSRAAAAFASRASASRSASRELPNAARLCRMALVVSGAERVADVQKEVAASPDGLAGEEATFSLCSF